MTLFDVDTALCGRQQRCCYNVETTSCACWEEVRLSILYHLKQQQIKIKFKQKELESLEYYLCSICICLLFYF